MGSSSVAAIVVTYNRREVLAEALDAIAAQSTAPQSVCVVDNASQDGTEEMVRHRFPSVEYLRLADNTGPAGGFAAGLRHHEGRAPGYFWFLDDDSRPQPHALERVLEVAHRLPRGGAVGLDGGILRRGVPHHGAGRGADGGSDGGHSLGAGVRRCDFILWDGAVISRPVVAEIGYPRAELFIMMEDIEYTNRIAAAGWDVVVLDEPLIERGHLGSGGDGSQSPPWRGYYQTRNHLLLAREHRSLPELVSWAGRSLRLVAGAVLVLDRRRDRVGMRLLGAWHGARGLSGRRVDPAS